MSDAPAKTLTDTAGLTPVAGYVGKVMDQVTGAIEARQGTAALARMEHLHKLEQDRRLAQQDFAEEIYGRFDRCLAIRNEIDAECNHIGVMAILIAQAVRTLLHRRSALDFAVEFREPGTGRVEPIKVDLETTAQAFVEAMQLGEGESLLIAEVKLALAKLETQS